MLSRGFRSGCLQRVYRSKCCQAPQSRWRRVFQASSTSTVRAFIRPAVLRGQDDRKTPQISVEHAERPMFKAATPESVAPELVQKPQPKGPLPATKDDMLKETVVSSKEQRTIDISIMKEMVQYLWPKGDFGTKLRV